jgi:hypothetical protein
MKTYRLKKNAGTNPSQMVGSAAPENVLETAEAMLAPVEVDWE